MVQVLLRLWKHECKRVIADRFTAPEDVVWFDYTLAKLVEEELGEEERMVVDLGVDSYFVDFLRDAPEATGNDQKHIQIQKKMTAIFTVSILKNNNDKKTANNLLLNISRS